MTLRQKLHRELDTSDRDRVGLSPLNKVIAALIVLSVVATVLETEPKLGEDVLAVLEASQWVFGAVFLVEYLARLWTAVERPEFAHPIRGRLRWAMTPAALIDLAALSPLLIAFLGDEPYLLRLARLIRVLRVARLNEFSTASATLRRAIMSRRFELGATFAVAFLMMLVTSTLLYVVEGEVQPEDFGSIPRAMWWSVATLTTVGYGDAVPITPLGRVLAGLTAVTGIGLIAMPTGILAAALSNALEVERAADAARKRAREEARRRPHDGV